MNLPADLEARLKRFLFDVGYSDANAFTIERELRALLAEVAQRQREVDVDDLRESGQHQAATSIESSPLVTDTGGKP